MMTCPSRTQARPPRGEITERDRAMLAAINTTGIMTTRHLEHLFSMSTDMVRRRTRLLRDYKLLSVAVESMHDCNRYRLTPEGRRFIGAWQSEEPRRPRAVSSLMGRMTPHHEHSIDVYIALRLGIQQQSSLTLDAFLFEPEIRARLHSGHGCIIPDAFAVISSPETDRLGLAIEVDLDTETVVYVVRTKGMPYITLAQLGEGLLGVPSIRVCFITTSIERRNAIAMALWENECPEDLWYLTTLERIKQQPFTGPIWVTPRLSNDGLRATLATESPLLTPSRQGS